MTELAVQAVVVPGLPRPWVGEGTRSGTERVGGRWVWILVLETEKARVG